MSTNVQNGRGQKFTVNASMGKMAMGMRRQLKIKVMMWWVGLALLGGGSFVQAADNILLWQFQDAQTGIQYPRASTVDSHGNLIITGYTDAIDATHTTGDDDFYTIKVSSDGQTILWSARYDHPQGDDWAVAVAVDGFDNVIVTGFVNNGINDDIAVIKYDGATGLPIWSAPFIFNGAANGNDMPQALAVDTLDNIFVAGYSDTGGSTGEDGILFKLGPGGGNPDHGPLWKVPYNGTANGNDQFTSVSAGPGGVAVAGYSTVAHSGGRTDFDFLTMKVDALGQPLWTKLFDNGIGNDQAFALGMDSAGNVVVAGDTMVGGQQNMVTIKYAAADGSQGWSAPYSGGTHNSVKGLAVDSDDEVYVTGESFTNSGKEDFYTARYASANGGTVWDEVFDSGSGDADIPQALALDHTGGLYVTGRTHLQATGDNDIQTLKYNKDNGQQIWQHGPPVGGAQQPVGVAVALGVSADGNVYVAGWSQPALNDVDYFAVKYNAGLLNSPTTLLVSVVSTTEIDLTWQDNSNPPNNEDTFCVERCQGFACSNFVGLTCDLAQNVTSYQDTSVGPDLWYSYRVKGKSVSLGYSLPSAPASALTTVIDYPAPDWLYLHDTQGLNDEAYAIAVGSDNNPVATGLQSTVVSQYDYFTVKLDRSVTNTPLWIADYDDPDGQADQGVCLAVDSNDEVAVSGFSSMDNGLGSNTNAIFTIKYAQTGPDIHTGFPLWTAQYNGPGSGSGDNRAKAVATASDGTNAMVVTGYGRNDAGNDDIFLIKYKPEYDAANQQVWAITPYNSGFDDYPMTTAFTTNGDVVVVGKTYNAAGNSDVFVSKYRGTDGALISGWPYTHDFGHGADGINALAVAADGSIYVAGFAMNAAGNEDIYINKFTGGGLPQWDSGKIIDGGGHGFDEAVAIAIDPVDGDIVVGCTITSASGSMDFHLLRYKTDGSVRWQKTLDLVGHDEMLVGMALSPSGEICLAGETEKGTDTDVLAVKYDHAGNLTGSTKFDHGFDDTATAITGNRLGEFYIAGYAATGALASDDYDFVVFRFNGQDQIQAPSPLSATSNNTTAVLSWAENNDATISGYNLYRKNGACPDGGASFSQSDLIHTAAAGTTTFTDSGINIGTTYCYGVAAFNSSINEESRMAERQVSTTVPVPPNNVVAIANNTSDVEICWHDNSSEEDGFLIERCAGENCDFSQVTTLTAPAEPNGAAVKTCFVDTTACDSGAGKKFRYRVEAYREGEWTSGFDGASGTVTVSVLSAPTSLITRGVSETFVKLQWLDTNVDETDFAIERCQGENCAVVGTTSRVRGIVLNLPMNELSWPVTAGAVVDYSGKGYSATAYGGPTPVADSTGGRPDIINIGNAGSFDGSNDYLSAPLVIDQSGQAAGVTMMAWVKPASTSSNYHYLFSTEDGTTTQPRNSWGLLRNGALWYVATGEGVRSTGFAVTAGQWQHVAVVFTPGAPGTVAFYKDGSLVNINYLGTHATSANFTVGRQGVLNQYFFDGLVDDLAVYNRPLTAGEIQQLRSGGVFPESTFYKWFTDTTVSANASYTYQVRARKQTSCGIALSPPSAAVPVTAAPPAPSSLTATRNAPGIVTLAWTPQTTTQTGFQVERCNGGSCTAFATITSAIGATTTKFTDNTPCYGSDGIIRYQVKALGPWGESLPSNVAQVTSVADAAPATLTASKVTEASVTLSWSYDPNRDGFRIERCTGSATTCNAQGAIFTEVAGSPFAGQDTALQALWRLDDSSWVDSSGQGHTGTGNYGVALDSPGATIYSGYGGYGAARFDGVDDYISTNLNVDQSTTTPGATFMAWVYPTNQASAYRHVFSTDNGGVDWGLSLNNGSWYVDTGNSSTSVSSVTYNTWQLMTVVFDPATGVKVYKNGALQNSTAFDIGYDSSAATFTIGRQGTAGGNYFDGKIDEVRVFSRPLSATEVNRYYLQGVGPLTFTDKTSLFTLNTAYTYRVTPLVNSTCGDWQQKVATPAKVAVTTPAAPSAPSNLNSGAPAGTTKFTLTWQANTSSESNFIIERCQGANCTSFALLDSVGPGVTAYTDTSVCAGQVYRYRVKAVKGTEWETGYVTWALAGVTIGNANAVAALPLTVVSESEIDIAWTDNNSDEDVYELSRCRVEPGVTACDQPGQFALLPNASFPGSISGAVIQYHMDEAAWTGTTYDVLDDSGNNWRGTSHNAQTVATGYFGRAGSFNGSTSYVSTPNTVITDQSRNSAGVTMEAWVKPNATDTNPRHLLSTENGGYDWGVVVKGSGANAHWYVNTGLSQMDTGLTVDLNTWQHVTAVFTPLVGVKFYKYSTGKGMEVFSNPEIGYDISTSVLEIGRSANNATASYYFNGLIDEVLVYSRPLTAAEVADQSTYQVVRAYTAYSYQDKTVQHSNTYFYKVTAKKAAGCSWAKEFTNTASTPAPPAPTDLVVTTKNSTGCTLGWRDNNGSETGYVVGRCPGASYTCGAAAVEVSLPAGSGTGSLSYADTGLCQGQQYTYRVWATGVWGVTDPVDLTMSTDAQPSTPTNLIANQVSEVEIDLSWTVTPLDATGVKLQRCRGASCVDIPLPPNTTTYADSELAPSTEYCYQVSVYKTATCSWETAPAGPVCASTNLSTGALTATPVDTTTVNLAWSDTTQTETASTVERCAGNLAACCNGDPASCAGTFTSVGVANANQHEYADSSACAGSAYTYRVHTQDEGLSLANNGCWTKGAPLTFTAFAAFTGVEVVIPYQAGMRADFADLRFYDATAHRELQYWLKQKTNSSTATVWLMTGANANITLYYGNPVAASASKTEELFTEVYDEFQGTTINPQKWVVIDTTSLKISQNNGLKFAYKNNENNDAAVLSTKTFGRAADNELYIDFTVGSDSLSRYDTFAMGWEQDQTTSPVISSNGAHLVYLTSSSNHYTSNVYEDNQPVYFTKLLYNSTTRYQTKIVLKANAGAKYYLKGGAYANWQLLTETSTARPDDDMLRIGFHQLSHNITIHQVKVKSASAQSGASVNFAAVQGDGATCLTFTNTWTGAPTRAAEVAMGPALPPSALSANVVEGQVVLSWTAGTGDESEFLVERNCGSGYAQVGAVPGATLTYSDASMPVSTPCAYQVKGHKEVPCPWTTLPSNEAQTVAPPSGPVVSATAENALQIRLDWTDAADEEGYEVEVMVMNGAWVPVATVLADTLSYTDSHGVNPGTQYTYRVRARRTTGNSAWGQASATTPAYPAEGGGISTCPSP